jgi:hypothetical protein
MQGEELLMVDLEGTADSLAHLDNNKNPHFKVEVIGRLKGHGGEKRIKIPIAKTTEGTRLQPGKWVKRLVETLEQQGQKSGKILQRILWPPSLMEFQDDFHTYLEKVQATTTCIGKEVDMGDTYGLGCSTR